MKVNLESRVGGITGKAGDVVYCYYRHYKVMYARRYVYPTLSEQNRKTGSITANLHKLKPSEAYIADLRDYVWKYNMLPVSQRVPLRAWNNAFLRLMHGMAKMYCNIDLQSVVGVDLQSTSEKARNSQRSRGNNPQDTTGCNPMLQSSAGSGAKVTIDLRTITREFIYANALPCISVARAVDAGLLPKVKGWQEMTAEM